MSDAWLGPNRVPHGSKRTFHWFKALSLWDILSLMEEPLRDMPAVECQANKIYWSIWGEMIHSARPPAVDPKLRSLL